MPASSPCPASSQSAPSHPSALSAILPAPPSLRTTSKSDEQGPSIISATTQPGGRSPSASNSPDLINQVLLPRATTTAPSDARRSSSSSTMPRLTRPAPVHHQRDCVVGSDQSEALVARGLDVNDRAQMDEFMGCATQAADCEMAAEVVDLLIPRHESEPGMHPSEVVEVDRFRLQRYIRYWTSLTPHPLCVLISTIILLERLKARHPGLSTTGHLKDTTLRVVFSAYLIAMKVCTEVSYLNYAFQSRTPWSLEEMNAMERELLAHLSWNVFIPADQIVERGQAFWKQREASDARLYRDDGGPDFQALLSENLFFMSSTFP